MKYVFLVFTFLFFSACSSGVQYVSVPTINDNRVYVDSALPKDLVKNIKQIKNLNGLLEFELILKSNSNRDIIYKVVWLDKNGFELLNAIDNEYRTIRIVANKDRRIKKIASNKNAVDFKIYIQRK